MMTTQRTAIRRRLAIRRMAHGPPWRARKARHSPIVAPLAATLATLALGVGVAFAHAERERRVQRRKRAQERTFGPLQDERLEHGLRRMALGQLDVAIEALTGEGEKTSPEKRIHEA